MHTFLRNDDQSQFWKVGVGGRITNQNNETFLWEKIVHFRADMLKLHLVFSRLRKMDFLNNKKFSFIFSLNILTLTTP